MKLLKIDKVLREKIVEANTKKRNVQLVPCCYEGMVGEYVDWEAVTSFPEVYNEHLKVIGVSPDPSDIVEVEVDNEGTMPMATLKIKV